VERDLSATALPPITDDWSATTAAALSFAATITRERGRVSTSDVAALRQAGFSDEEIVEIVAAVALNVFRNYFNLVVGTVIDFPVVRTGHAMLAAGQP
jgi:alkylhydroperoxidase family enzyme